MIDISASNLHEAFLKATEVVRELATASDPVPYCWFRGVNDCRHALLPGAYWRKDYDEFGPMVQFSQEGGVFAEVGAMDSWETYYLAQHHGIPTRLLDWTESFAAAVFFALEGHQATVDPCIWILRPAALNEASIDWFGVLAPNNHPQELGIWLPKEMRAPKPKVRIVDGFTYDNRRPLALYPRKSNRRIVAQQGMFTVHGRKRICLREYISKSVKDPHSALARVRLVGLDAAQAQRDLEMLGVRRSNIYPDIDNFVQDMKRQHGWS